MSAALRAAAVERALLAAEALESHARGSGCLRWLLRLLRVRPAAVEEARAAAPRASRRAHARRC